MKKPTELREACRGFGAVGAELDLLVVRGNARLGFEFTRTTAPATTRSMHVALEDLRVSRSDVIHAGSRSVVGIKKYIYDIFGDTVNTTSRLEALSQPMAINASQQVVDRLNDRFSYTHRGKLAVKGKGEMDMYFIHWEDAL